MRSRSWSRRARVRFAVLAVLLVVSSLVGVDGRQAAQATFKGTRDGRIVYDQNGTLRTVAPDGTDDRPLPAPPAGFADQHPRWSPDGTLIAFSRRNTDPDLLGIAQIMVMKADGSDQRRLTSAFAISTHPAWSRDGTKLVYSQSDDGRTFNLFVTDRATGRTDQVTTATDVVDTNPEWSPVNDVIVFERLYAGPGPFEERSDLFTLDFASGAFTRLTSRDNRGGALSRAPSWSPDGTRIAFEGVGTGGFIGFTDPDIFILSELDEEVPTVTLLPFGAGTEPAWSPTGTNIVFVSSSGRIVRQASSDPLFIRAISSLFAVGPSGSSPDWQALDPPAEPDIDLLAALVQALPTVKYHTSLRRPDSSDRQLEHERPGGAALLALGLDVDGAIGSLPDVDAAVVPLLLAGQPAVRLRVTPSLLGLGEQRPVKVEVEVSVPGPNGFRARFGVDGRDSVIPKDFQGTLVFLPGGQFRVDVETLDPGAPDAALVAVGTIVANGGETDLTAAFTPCDPGPLDDVPADRLPSPFRASVGVDLGQPLRVEVGLSHTANVKPDVTTGAEGLPPTQRFNGRAGCLPAEVPSERTILPATSLRAEYSPVVRSAHIQAPGRIPALDFGLTSTSDRGRQQLRIEAKDVPEDVEVHIGPADPGARSTKARYQASGRLGEVTVDFGSTPAGPPEALADGETPPLLAGRVFATEVPVDDSRVQLDVDFGNSGSETIDAHGQTIGLVEVSLDSAPGLISRPSLFFVPTIDGVVVHNLPARDDQPARLSIDARVHDLRRLDLVREGGTPDSTCQPATDYKICARLDVGRPGALDLPVLHVGLLKASKDHPEDLESVLATLNHLTAGVTVVRLSDLERTDDVPIRFFYDAPRSTASFGLDKFRHAPGNTVDRSDTLTVALTPMPAHLEGCFYTKSAVCAGRTQRFEKSLASASIHASETFQLTLNTRVDDNDFLNLGATLKDLTFSSSSIPGCLGDDGEAFVHTGPVGESGVGQTVVVDAELKTNDADCETVRHLVINLRPGFWADNRDVVWDHPLDGFPEEEHGTTSCIDNSDLANIAVVDGVSVLGVDLSDLNIDTFLCNTDSAVTPHAEESALAVVGTVAGSVLGGVQGAVVGFVAGVVAGLF